MPYPNLQKYPYIAYDTETTGLIYPVDRVFGFAVAAPDGKSWYWDIRQHPKAVDWINDQMKQFKGTVICHNASFDYRMSLATGIDIPIEQLDDTGNRACCIDEHLYSYDLDTLLHIYLDERKLKTIYQELAELFGGLATRNVQMKNLHRAPPEKVSPYARQDAGGTLRLWEWQEEHIRAEGLEDIVGFEHDIMPSFIRSEVRGVHVDTAKAEETADKLTPIIEEHQTRLNDMAGWEFNVNSGPQVKKLMEPYQGPDDEWYVGNDRVGTTDTGNPSIGAAFLREMSHPAASLILDIRSLIKTRDTFLRGHVIGHAYNGIVYPNINQNKSETGGTGTGRLSYSDPALQQIPSRRKDVAAMVKACFLPPPGMVWVDCDKDSFEVRVFFHLINDPSINALYAANPNYDGHQITADITGLPRNPSYGGQPNAKQLNLSMIFNQGNGSTAEKLGLPWEWDEFETDDGRLVRYKRAGWEAMEVINEYHRHFPGVKVLADGCKNKALSRGWIHTRRGRRLRFPRGFKAYKASGLLIQATAADYNKENWGIIEDQLNGVGHLILNTHDSYGLALPRRGWRRHFKRVQNAIQAPGRARVPLTLSLSGHGPTWWDAVKEN